MINKELRKALIKLVCEALSDKNNEFHNGIVTILKEYYGIDYYYDENGNILFDINDDHQDNVDTNDVNNPKPFVAKLNNYTIYSIFVRKSGIRGNEPSGGNPMIDAMKGKEGYYYGNSEVKREVYRRIALVMQAIPEAFDTVIKTASTNFLNDDLFILAQENIRANAFYDGIFSKLTFGEVYERFKQTGWYKKAHMDKKSNDLKEYLDGIFIKNFNKIFKYRKLGSDEGRLIMPLPINVNPDKVRDEDINGKSILILDDTATTGKTLSDSANALMETYAPDKITFLTIFSPRDNRNLTI